jgi:hypothetical protein
MSFVRLSRIVIHPHPGTPIKNRVLNNESQGIPADQENTWSVAPHSEESNSQQATTSDSHDSRICQAARFGRGCFFVGNRKLSGSPLLGAPAFESKPKAIVGAECLNVLGNENLFLLPGHIDLAEYESTLGIAQGLSGTLLSLHDLPGSIRYALDETGAKYQARLRARRHEPHPRTHQSEPSNDRGPFHCAAPPRLFFIDDFLRVGEDTSEVEGLGENGL